MTKSLKRKPQQENAAVITTTLAAIRKHSPCESGWEKLLKSLGKTRADSEPLRFSTILESNGLHDAFWCLRALPKKHHAHIRLMACDFAERVLPIFEKERPGDTRPREAIEIARRFARGEVSAAANAAACAAAWDAANAAASAAAWAAGDATRAAASAAACAATSAAAWAATRAAACAAISAAARAATSAAAWAAGDAERKIQAELLVKYFG